MDLVIRAPLLLGAGALFAFGPPLAQLSALLLFPVACGRGVLLSSFLTACFYAMALIPAGLAAMEYTHSLPWSLLCWLVPLSVNTVVMTVGLSAPARWRVLAVVTAVSILSLPPLASLSLVSPLALAGLLFPGMGSTGLAAMLALIGALCWLPAKSAYRQQWPFAGVALLSLLSHSYAIATPVDTDVSDMIGLHTHRGMPESMTRDAFRMAWRYDELERSDSQTANTIVWPESTYADWQELDGDILSHTPKKVIGGARLWVSDDRYVNALVMGKTGELVYAQRSPLPFSLGRPVVAVSSKHLIELAPENIAALLCFEITNTWQVARTFSSAESTVIWAANLGWSSNDQLAKRLIQQVHLWSALYRKPAAIAVNYAEVSA